MMNFRLATASLALTLACAGQAGAISRIRADQNSCATLQQTLEREDAAVIRWPSARMADYFLYDRYVSPLFRCRWPERPVATTVPAADNPRCVVHRCEEVEPLFEPFGRPRR